MSIKVKNKIKSKKSKVCVLKVKFMGINFCGQANVKYFQQMQLLRFYKDTTKVSSLPLFKITTKSTNFLCVKKKTQKQLSRLGLRKSCSENLQQIYRRTPMPKCDFNKFANELYWNHTFSKIVNKEATIFQKISYFLLHSSFLSIDLHKSMHKNELF